MKDHLISCLLFGTIPASMLIGYMSYDPHWFAHGLEYGIHATFVIVLAMCAAMHIWLYVRHPARFQMPNRLPFFVKTLLITNAFILAAQDEAQRITKESAS